MKAWTHLLINKNQMKTVIIGAGLSGLSLAYYLEKQGIKDYILLEKSSGVGGLCKSIKKEGFTFDMAIHMLHLRNEEIINCILYGGIWFICFDQLCGGR